MNGFLKRTFGLCSALLMSFAFSPNTHAAIIYKAENLFWELYSENCLDIFSLINDVGALREKTNVMLDKSLEENVCGEEEKDDKLERKEAVKCAMCNEDITPDEYAYSCEGCLRAKNPDLRHVYCVFRHVMNDVLINMEKTKAYRMSRGNNPTCPGCNGPVPRYTPFVIVPNAKLPAIR